MVGAMVNATCVLASFSRLAVSPRCSAEASTSGSAGSSHGRLGLAAQARRNAAAAGLSWSAEAGAEADTAAAVAAVSCPALQHANLMWFKGAYNAQVFCGEDEAPDSVVRRFRKAVMQAGVIPECRRRRFFETPQDIVKRKQAARRKKPRRTFLPREGEEGSKGPGAKSKSDDDNDFWGFAEEGADVNF